MPTRQYRRYVYRPCEYSGLLSPTNNRSIRGDNGELTRDLPTARLPHHATNAVYPTASPHVVLCPGFSRKRAKARRAGFFCAEFNSSYACQKLRVTRVSRLTTASQSIGGHGDFVHWRRGPAVAQGYGVANRGQRRRVSYQRSEIGRPEVRGEIRCVF